MKKSYATPLVAVSGDVVRETLVGLVNTAPESETSKPAGAGAVGYYL